MVLSWELAVSLLLLRRLLACIGGLSFSLFWNRKVWWGWALASKGFYSKRLGVRFNTVRFWISGYRFWARNAGIKRPVIDNRIKFLTRSLCFTCSVDVITYQYKACICSRLKLWIWQQVALTVPWYLPARYVGRTQSALRLYATFGRRPWGGDWYNDRAGEGHYHGEYVWSRVYSSGTRKLGVLLNLGDWDSYSGWGGLQYGIELSRPQVWHQCQSLLSPSF